MCRNGGASSAVVHADSPRAWPHAAMWPAHDLPHSGQVRNTRRRDGSLPRAWLVVAASRSPLAAATAGVDGAQMALENLFCPKASVWLHVAVQHTNLSLSMTNAEEGRSTAERPAAAEPNSPMSA